VFFATLNGVEHEKDLFTAGRKEVDAMSVRREVGKAVGAAKVKVMLTQDPQLPVDYCERCVHSLTHCSHASPPCQNPTCQGCVSVALCGCRPCVSAGELCTGKGTLQCLCQATHRAEKK
jgi:hypothetical protein